MIKIENTNTYGWEAAVRGLRNPMNSWAKSDSMFTDHQQNLGNADHNLMLRMNKAGSEESKYRRMITVTMDVVAPLYWWKEFDTYKVGTVCNSCSTMHKIHSKEFTVDDFSHEHLCEMSMGDLKLVVAVLNHWRYLFNETKDKKYWWQIIQLLPSSYNQRRTIQLNYEVLAQQYRQRKNHKLDEWREYCDWIKTLPYSDLIVGVPEENGGDAHGDGN